MPYQKRLKKTYGAIESRAQSGSDYKFGGGGLDSTGDTNFTNNNNNVSTFDVNYRKYQLCIICLQHLLLGKQFHHKFHKTF